MEIDARIGDQKGRGIRKSLVEICGRIFRVDRVDDALVLPVKVKQAEEVRGAFGQRSIDIRLNEIEIVTGLLLDERISRIPRRIVAQGGYVPGEFVGAGFGKNFDPAVADFVELSGERILIDADLPDGRLGGNLASGESVNVYLATARAGGRASERLKFVLQFVGIVRESIEIASLHYQRA